MSNYENYANKAEGDLTAADAALTAAQTEQSNAASELNSIKPLAQNVERAQGECDAAVEALRASQEQAAQKETAFNVASDKASQAADALARARELNNAFAPFADEAAAAEAFASGEFAHSDAAQLDPTLASRIANRKAAFDAANEAKTKAQEQLTQAQTDVTEKQAAYDRAARQLVNAQIELEEAQEWYDAEHPAPKPDPDPTPGPMPDPDPNPDPNPGTNSDETKPGATPGETTPEATPGKPASSDDKNLEDKLANAKHAPQDAQQQDVQLAQTGDSDMVFAVGGMMFVAAGAAAAAAAARRRQS